MASARVDENDAIGRAARAALSLAHRLRSWLATIGSAWNLMGGHAGRVITGRQARGGLAWGGPAVLKWRPRPAAQRARPERVDPPARSSERIWPAQPAPETRPPLTTLRHPVAKEPIAHFGGTPVASAATPAGLGLRIQYFARRAAGRIPGSRSQVRHRPPAVDGGSPRRPALLRRSVAREPTAAKGRAPAPQRPSKLTSGTHARGHSALWEAARRSAGAGPPAGAVSLHDRLLLPPRLVRRGFAWLEALSRGVHVHVGSEAHALARAADARALTVGRDIYMREGRFEPSSPVGLALLAHELVHVWQHTRAGEPLAQREHARHEAVLERHARAVEFSVLNLLRVPSDDRQDDGPSLDAPPALQLARPARPVDSAYQENVGSTRRPTAGALALAAPEPRPVEPAAPAQAPAADPAELAGQVLRLMERRLRVDRERLGIGAA